jgi:hypothetical protein
MQRAQYVLTGVIAALWATAVAAEPSPQAGVAAAGGGGVYVNAGLELLSSRKPVAGKTGYRIERRTKGGAWTQLAELQTPQSYEQFVAGFKQSERVIPSPVVLEELPMKKLWDKADTYRNLDSLHAYSGVLAFRVALGVTWCDTTVTPGATYEYRVSTLGEGGKGLPMALSEPTTFPSGVTLAPLKSSGSDCSEKHVMITWTPGTGERPAALKVYRRDDLKGAYSRIYPATVISAQKGRPLTFKTQDTTVKSFHAYQYFAVPIDFYGNQGRGSDTLQAATYRFLAISLPRNIKAASLDSLGGIRLSWRLPDTTNVRGIEVYRSSRWDSAYVRIAAVGGRDTGYVDQNVAAMRNYFYQLRLTGLFGERSPATARVSGMYKSKRAPLPPAIVRSQGLANGVRLELLSQEGAVEGYRVYRSAGAGAPMKLTSDLVKRTDSLTVYLDTAKELRGSVQYGYCARAENASHVLSVPSDTAWVRPAISTRPPAPLGLQASLAGRTAVLHWQDMALVEPTVRGYRAYRREVPASGQPPAFTEVKMEDSLLSRNELVDSSLADGRSYEYAARSIDRFGGQSDLSSVARVTFAGPQAVQPPQGMSCRPLDGAALVSWSPTLQSGLTGIKLYRFERGRKPTLVASLAAGAVEYLDKTVGKGKLYFYCLTSTTAAGLESAPSVEVGIRP